MEQMFDLSSAKLENLVVHKVGNKLREEGMILSPGPYHLTDGNVEELLLKYFLFSFREKMVYRFYHETDLHLNELYMYISSVFIHPETFYEQSVNILKHLYESSGHPQIRCGEFYMAYFSGCTMDSESVDAIGIFKTEKKETYLKVDQQGGTFFLDQDTGINVRKLDKGCIVFNTHSPDGYRVAIVDAVNKGSNQEALYWKDEFLRLANVEDEYFHTASYLNLCRDFSENIYGPVCQADKKDQVIFMNEALAYFDNHDEFQLEQFAREVIKEPEIIQQFKEHKQSYDMNQGKGIQEFFDISAPALKSAKRKFKNLIKLDTDIEIKVGNPVSTEGDVYIERGFDQEKGMHFYKVFFNEEA
jgi:hypothetical protein